MEYYYAAVRLLLANKRYADAFQMFERSRSRALSDLLATRQPGLARPLEQKLFTESAVLRTQIADAQGRLFELANQADAAVDATRVARLETEIRTLESQYDQVTSRMAAEAPRLQNLVTSTPATLDALQRSMRDEHYELLQYLVTDTDLIVWHIAPGSITVRNVFLPRNVLVDKVASLQKSLADRNAPFDETTAQELFLYLDCATAADGQERQAGDHPSRRSSLRAVPGVQESRGWTLPRRALPDYLCAKRRRSC